MTGLRAIWTSVRGEGDAPDETALRARVETATERLRPIAVDAESLVRALAAIEGPLLDDDRATEVALALRCAAGDAAAIARFEETELARLPTVLSRLRLDADLLDEVRQEVRRKLLVGENGEPPKILGYAGRGRMNGLVKVVATRAALDRLERRKRDAPGSTGAAAAPSPERDPELQYLDAHYRAAFARAFEEAARSLERRERNWLRLHLLDGAGLEEIAKMYGVHRSTVVRTLEKARKHLLDETRKGMRRDLEIGLVELDSIMRLVGSRLDASVARVLRSSTG